MSSLVRILAIGSLHGDDQAAWRIADALRGRGFESALAIQNVDQLLEHLAGDERVVLIDACSSGAATGTLFRFEWPDPRITDRTGLSSHGIDLPYVLRLAEALGRLPQDVVVYAIEIHSAQAGEGMSPEVAAAVQLAAESIAEELLGEGATQRCTNDL
ncbi:hydrogenase maturation protease [Blastopirellula sp. JC733]|nr:hydrogenase maturation protease [Blastopirellula sediminis]